jgi:polysaccharide export outer membrane protein
MTRPFRPSARPARLLLAAAVASALGGCEVPGSGPLRTEVATQQVADYRFPFRLVIVTPEMVPIIADGDAPRSGGFVTDLGPQEPGIAPGDTIQVTIAEAAGGGLFSPPPALPGNLPAPLPQPGTLPGAATPSGRGVTLPPATVGTDGRIVVPFAGAVAAAGRTPAQIAASIDGALRTQSLDAHATVRIAGRAGRIDVAGAVRSPGAMELQQGGERLLDLISRAGGPSIPTQNAVVQLNRFGSEHRVRLAALLDDPDLNIHARTGDVVTLIDAPRRYTVLGAGGPPPVIERSALPGRAYLPFSVNLKKFAAPDGRDAVRAAQRGRCAGGRKRPERPAGRPARHLCLPRGGAGGCSPAHCGCGQIRAGARRGGADPARPAARHRARAGCLPD